MASRRQIRTTACSNLFQGSSRCTRLVLVVALQLLVGVTLLPAARASITPSGQFPSISSSSRVHNNQNRYNKWILRRRGGASTGVGIVNDDPVLKVPQHQTENVIDGIVMDDESDETETLQETAEQEENEADKGLLQSKDDDIPQQRTLPPVRRSAKRRRTSDMIQSLLERSFDSRNTAGTTITTNANQQEESNELRQLITERANEYVQALHVEDSHHHHHLGQQQHQQHPKKLLHVLAPKIPAIHYSPNIMLRIQSAARSDMDAGVAACLLATLARVCELYDRQKHHHQQQLESSQENQDGSSDGAAPVFHSSASDVINDRRFEQLVECVLCGLDIKRLLREPQHPKRSASEVPQVVDEDGGKDSQVVADDIIPIDQQEQASDDSIQAILMEHVDQGKVEDGLSLRDACRAAWGIAILGGHHYDSIGGESVMNIFLALSLRVRELLLAQLDRLCREDLSYYDDVEKRKSSLGDSEADDRLGLMAEEIAEDAATAMWAFACVRACTGIRTAKLFETCSFILCQDPYELRRRVQDTELNLGHADVVDRLALSDTEPDATDLSRSDQETESKEDKDALLDWLSPNEKTDMLWALALHGSSESYLSSKEDNVLSESAATLREIAFDRLVYWLRQDLDAVQSVGKDENATPDVLIVGQNEQVTETIESTPLSRSEDIIVDQDTLDSTHSTDNHSEDAPEVSTEHQVGQAPPVQLLQSSHVKKHPYFSSHDLCSIVWAVTELRDSLRCSIVELVTEIFVAQGPTSTDQLVGGDLTNLVWALAKHACEKVPGMPLSSSVVLLTTWAAQSALRRIIGTPEKQEIDHEDVLRAFQPPELSRIIWSVATTLATCRDSATEEHRKVVSRLFKVVLTAAGSHLSVFASEDLARIAWAFLEICLSDNYLSELDVIDALAKILITIESSVLRWEKGFCSSTDAETSKKVNESILFATFFGKSRTATPLFDQRIAEVRDEEDDAFDGGTTSAKRSGLPLLRDLSIDPCTLCKVAHGYSKLSASRPFVKGSGTLTRIAVRLLASENGQLMKECSFHDIVRLLEAVATSESSDRQYELIARLFARRVVRMLNEELLQPRSEGDSPPSGIVSRLSSSEKCVVVESLGRLGVRLWSNDNDARSAYRKLRLVVADNPLFSAAQLSGMPISDMAKLIRGLVLMDAGTCNSSLLLTVLQGCEEKIKDIQQKPDLCSLVASLGKIGQCLDVSDLARHSPLNVVEEGGVDQRHADLNDLAAGKMGNCTDFSSELRSACRRLLSAVASQAIPFVPGLEVEELRKIVDVYTFLPVQEDNLFCCIEDDIKARKRNWNIHERTKRAHLKEATELAQNLLRSSMGAEENAGRPTKGFLHFLLFKDSTTASPQYRSKTDPNSSVIQELLNKLLILDNDREDQSPGQSSDSEIRDILEGSYYGLCCCEELVATYRRIEFTTGTHKSRYDKHRRRDIAKRVLSRLIPSPGYFHGY